MKAAAIIWILYTFTSVSNGTHTHSQEFNSKESCYAASKTISDAIKRKVATSPSASVPDIEMMVCVPK